MQSVVEYPGKAIMKNKILIIDDDKDVCKTLTNNLSEEGYRTRFVFNGLDGVAKVKKEEYDLIILDLKLPDIYGTEVLKRIRSFNKEVVIIILTAYPSIETAIETLKNRASDYILKPFDINHLRVVIKRELVKRSTKEELRLTEITDIGRRIKELRKNKELTLDALAERTKLSKSFLSELERQKKFPRLDTLQTIARELGVSVYFFFKE